MAERAADAGAEETRVEIQHGIPGAAVSLPPLAPQLRPPVEALADLALEAAVDGIVEVLRARACSGQ